MPDAYHLEILTPAWRDLELKLRQPLREQLSVMKILTFLDKTFLSDSILFMRWWIRGGSMQLRLNANHLKLIAIIAMTIDHVSDLIYPGFPAEPAAMAIHIIGRLTAPIMWFFVCEGYYYTHNVKRYMLRMGIFAVISHFAYCFAFGINPIPFSTGFFNQTSVMYPLFVAILILWIQDNRLTMKNETKNSLIFILVWSASHLYLWRC